MSERPPPAEDPDADLQVQAALRRAEREPSPSHDAAILAAAQKTAEQIRSRRKPRRWLLPVSLAASVLGLSVWTGWVQQRATPAGDVLRGSADNRKIVAVVPRDGAVLDRLPAELRWQSAVVNDCTVELRDSQALVLWRSQPEDAVTLVLPEMARAALPTPGLYYWRVECRSGPDTVVGGPFRFQLRRSEP